MTRVLALDYGSARCGCAISDPDRHARRRRCRRSREPGIAAGIDRDRALVAEHDAGTVLVGLPVSLSGEEGPQAARGARLRGAARRRAWTSRCETYDERFTTKLAQTHSRAAPPRTRARPRTCCRAT